MIRCLVFDFDGVLVDSNVIKREAYYRIFAALGDTHNLVTKCLITHADGNRYQVIECVLRGMESDGMSGAGPFTPGQVVTYAQQYNDICEAYTATCLEIVGVSACLPRLFERYALYIDSTTWEGPLQRVVHKRGWSHYFQDVLGSPQTKVDNLTWILQQEKIAGSSVVFVGDGQRDLVAARACGCHFVGVRNAFNDFDTQDLVLIDNWYGLEQVIARFEE